MAIHLVLLSSLEKIMRNEPITESNFTGFSMLNNERKSFQLHISSDCDKVSLEIQSDLSCITPYTMQLMKRQPMTMLYEAKTDIIPIFCFPLLKQ